MTRTTVRDTTAHDLRQIYHPRPERLPRWLLRVWAWF
jgi:hypothetical protein